MNQAWCRERIEAAKTRIVNYETAMEDLASGKISSFTLDTGQSRQVVTRHNPSALESAINAAYNSLTTLEARCNGGQVVQARPGW